MDLIYYTGIMMVAFIVPFVLLWFILGIIWYCNKESEAVMLGIVMKNIVSKKNINKKPSYLVCHRKLKDADRGKFVLSSIFIASICVQIFFVLAIVEITHECINDPNLDCFATKDDVKVSDTSINTESPVNCSSISRNDFVTCYRITVFDPERGFIGAAGAYLSFKMLNFGLLVVAHVMLWAAHKCRKKANLRMFKLGFSLFIFFVLYLPLILRVYVEEVESAFRKISYTVFIQAGLVLFVIVHLVVFLPWEEFNRSPEYFGDVSLPIEGNVGEDENEVKSEQPLAFTDC